MRYQSLNFVLTFLLENTVALLRTPKEVSVDLVNIILLLFSENLFDLTFLMSDYGSFLNTDRKKR
jgi:hypothetical protein